MADVSSPEFWETAYRESRERWELGAPAPPIARALREIPAKGRAIVLGSGRGHEARAAAERGWSVVAVDFAESARLGAIRLTPPALAGRIEWRTQDLFTLGASDAGAFDLVIEHTSFCAVDPERRGEWIRVAREVLRPGGTLLALFYTHGREGGPPYGAMHAEVLDALGKRFDVVRHEVPSDSIERRRGNELLVWATARAGDAR